MTNQLTETGGPTTRVAGEFSGRAEGLGTLSVVMPVYNERTFVEGAVGTARRAAEAADWPIRFLVVDDGSTDAESRAVLERLGRSDDVDVVLLDQNQGRFAARAAGLERVTTPYVLLLDARVEVDPVALRNLRAQVEQHERTVWNFDVEPAERTPFALFWTGVTKVWWRDYFRNRSHVAFTDTDFNRYPKGTGAFFAPTHVLREAMASFSSLYDDPTLASDDTRLLRNVAAARPINIAPEVLCRHHVKAGGAAWVRQCRYRGTTFVDGYLGDARHATPLLIGTGVLGVTGAAWALRRPGRVLGAAAAGSVAAAGLTSWAGGSAREAASVGLLTTPFGVLFGSGLLRGLVMAGRRR